MGLHEEVVEICQRAEARIDVAIVGNVIAEINHRRRVNGRDPDRFDAKADKIVEPPRYPSEVAYAVVVGVLKRARVDLVDNRCLPPERSHANRAFGVYADFRLLITWRCQTIPPHPSPQENGFRASEPWRNNTVPVATGSRRFSQFS